MHPLSDFFSGADVSHPGPGSSLPSIAALVASFDKRMCAYAASIRVQESRTEIIVDLSNMFAVKSFPMSIDILLTSCLDCIKDVQG